MTLDPTFFLLLVNFVIVFIVLKRLLFKPLLEDFEKRESLTKGFRQKTKESEGLAESRLEEYKRRIHLTRTKIGEDLASIQKEATERQKEIVDSAAARSRDIMEKARAERRSIRKTKKTRLEPSLSCRIP